MKFTLALALLSLLFAGSWAWSWHQLGYLLVFGAGWFLGYAVGFGVGGWVKL